jgi:hypothetical protein
VVLDRRLRLAGLQRALERRRDLGDDREAVASAGALELVSERLQLRERARREQ